MTIYLCAGGIVIWLVLALLGLSIFVSRYRD